MLIWTCKFLDESDILEEYKKYMSMILAIIEMVRNGFS